MHPHSLTNTSHHAADPRYTAKFAATPCQGFRRLPGTWPIMPLAHAFASPNIAVLRTDPIGAGKSSQYTCDRFCTVACPGYCSSIFKVQCKRSTSLQLPSTTKGCSTPHLEICSQIVYRSVRRRIFFKAALMLFSMRLSLTFSRAAISLSDSPSTI